MATKLDWEPECQTLLEQARQGDRAAATKLFDYYAHHFLRVVRRRLTQPLRRLMDSVDILQEARLRLYRDGLPAEVFESKETFYNYLVGLVKHVLSGAQRHYVHAKKRSLKRDVPMEGSAAAEVPEQSGAVGARLAEEEQWAQLERDLPPVYRAIVRLVRAGQTQTAIAARLHVSDRTVRRVMDKLPHPINTMVS